MSRDVENIVSRLRELDALIQNFVSETTPQFRSFINIEQRITDLDAAHSGSWFGDHAFTYFSDFKSPPPGCAFDVEWGFVDSYFEKQNDGWRIFSPKSISDFIYQDEREKTETLKCLVNSSEAKAQEFKDTAIDLLRLLGGLGPFVEAAIVKIENAKPVGPVYFVNGRMKSAPRMSRDSSAVMKGMLAPIHVEESAFFSTIRRNVDVSKTVAQQLRRVISMIEISNPQQATAARTDKIFIGHGKSPVWRELKDFIEKLQLGWEEFNRTSPAGISTVQRLQDMLTHSTFAFLVCTAEDEQVDSSVHARENVIHEVGLFQGKLGFNRAIVLLEDGYAEFSNIHGLGQIRFPKGRISACFEEIRDVLKREGLIS